MFHFISDINFAAVKCVTGYNFDRLISYDIPMLCLIHWSYSETLV